MSCDCDDWSICERCVPYEFERAEFESSMGSTPKCRAPSVGELLEAQDWARRLIEE